MEFTTEVINDTTYYKTVSRGTRYSISINEDGTVDVISKRLSASWYPQFRMFESLKELESKIKAFAGFSALLAI